jgi:SAM-dependent methyltransferase
MNRSPWPWILTLLAAACQQPEKPAVVSAVPSATLALSASQGPSSGPADPPGFHLGRQIAPTMSHEGADWLIRPEREAEESSARMLKELKLEPGMNACDFGAGNGFHTLVMAKSVAPKGRAIAVDIQPEMLELLRGRARAAAVSNVDTILSTATDPKLPAGACDLILLADVYHELDDPAGLLQKLKLALRPKGVLALLEFRAEDPKVPIKPEHKMSRAQIMKELEANGFTLVRSFDELPWQHLMFFAAR